MKNYILIILLLNILTASAQTATESLRSSGKIYVVVGVIIIIFSIIVLYLLRLDRKITRLEKNQE